MQADLVVRGGHVFDGTGAGPVEADVAIADGRIVEIGRIDGRGVDEVDARGLSVTPGFIDIHSHSDLTLLADPRALSAIHQGVTTEVIGNCGHGCFPITDPALAVRNIYGGNEAAAITWRDMPGYLERLAAAKPAVNVLTLVPNGQLRLATVGLADRPATADELRRMSYLLDAALAEGAWGLSTGLEYAAEVGAPATEIATLCRSVARAGALYATHTRRRDEGAEGAVEEALAVARETGVRLQVSHLLPRNGAAAGEACVEAVELARAEGIDVAFDMHTRLFGTTYLHAALPPWAVVGGPREVAERLRDPVLRERMTGHRSIINAGGDWRRVVLLDNDVWPEYASRSLADIAAERGRAPPDAVLDLLLGATERASDLMVILHCYTEDQQRRAFAHPLCMPGSDATTLGPDGPLAQSVFHGAYTWAAWFYRFMVRQCRALSAEEAIHRLSGLPAKILNLADRGTLRPGARADIVVLALDSFGERGTTFAPNRLAKGVVHVLVNGIPTLGDGAPTGERAGQILLRRTTAAAAL